MICFTIIDAHFHISVQYTAWPIATADAALSLLQEFLTTPTLLSHINAHFADASTLVAKVM